MKETGMPLFRNSEMTMFSADGEWNHPCEVRISEGLITVSYNDDGQFVVYEGRETEPGHFKLHSPKVSGSATLHRFSGDEIFEGFWIEAGHQGMWRLQIEE